LLQPDKKYLTSDAQGAAYELATAKLAVSKASSPAVRQYAQMLVEDHEKFDTALIKLGQDEGVTLPTNMTAKDQARLARLDRLEGVTFDKVYVREALRINQQDEKDSKKELARTKDPRIKQFLQQFAEVD